MTLDETGEELLHLARDLCAALSSFLVTPDGDVTVFLPPTGTRPETRDRVSSLARSCITNPEALGTDIFYCSEAMIPGHPGITRMSCIAVPLRLDTAAEAGFLGILGIVDTAAPTIDDELRLGLKRIANRLVERTRSEVLSDVDQPPVRQAPTGKPEEETPWPLPVADDTTAGTGFVPAAEPLTRGFAAGSALSEQERAGQSSSEAQTDGSSPIAQLQEGTFLEEVVRHVPDPIMVVREDGTIIYASESISSVVATSASEVLGRDIVDLLDPFDPLLTETRASENLAKMIVGEPPPGQRVRMLSNEGSTVQVNICGTEFQSRQLGSCYVASLRLASESQSRPESNDELLTARSVINALEDALIAFDRHGVVILSNAAAATLHGLPADEELLGRPFPQNTALLASDGTRITPAEHPLARALGGATVRNEQLQLPQEKGGPRWLVASAQPLEIGRDGPGALFVLHDASAQREHEAWLTRLALYDPLTGVANRSLLLDHLNRALVRSRREGGRVSLLFCDLDGLKLVNDHYGHDVGDEVLTAVARRLEGVLRPNDTVARLGGDEFAAVAYMSSPDPAELDAVMRRVRTILSDPYQVRSQTLRVLVTLGSVVADGRADDATSVLVRADRELYRMKSIRLQGHED